MVILWVCYGYPMVLTAVYTIILITDLKKGASHRCPVVVFYARISGIYPRIKHRIYSILQKKYRNIWYFQNNLLPLQPQRMPTGTLDYKLTYRRKVLRR